MASEILFSYIIPTIGRSSLDAAVNSVLAQDFSHADFEIIVVNDSGSPLLKADWHGLPLVRILDTNKCERCFARNSGAAIAKGKYLAFLDDDDSIMPRALEYFWGLVQRSRAVMYFGGYRLVDSNGNTLDECFPDEHGNCFIRFMAGEWQPLQASLFDAEIFHSLGGFTSLNTLRGGDEDVDLTRRVSLEGDIVGVNALVASIRLDRNKSTTNYSNLQEQSLQSRDLILGKPGSFSRLWDSARGRGIGSAYWHGRMAWIYLVSVVWNLRQGYISIALSRMMYLCASLSVSLRFWFSCRFWRGAAQPHQAKGWLVIEK